MTRPIYEAHDPHALAVAMRDPSEADAERERATAEAEAATNRARAAAREIDTLDPNAPGYRARRDAFEADKGEALAAQSALYRLANAYAEAYDDATRLFAWVDDDDADPASMAQGIIGEALAELDRCEAFVNRATAGQAIAGEWPTRSASVNRAARLASAGLALGEARNAIERAAAAVTATLAPSGIDPEAIAVDDEIGAHCEAAEAKGHPWPPMQRPATMTATAWAAVKSEHGKGTR